MSDEKKPVTHADYQIAPGVFNLSKWSRENEPKPPPSFAVGDLVRLTTVTRIIKVYEDCDGTPLYQVECNGSGITEDSFTSATEEEREEYG